MDAKSRANFINSVVSGTKDANIICPECETIHTPDCKFCIICGADLSVPPKVQKDTPAFEPAKEVITPAVTVKYVEPNNVFAQGLPDWSIEPPQVMVRRR